jgi:diguanylate cyclase (GGDEF)-like protein/PAS domain S-box-containing protein
MAAEKMFGYRMDEAIGQDIAMLNPECESERCHIGLPAQMSHDIHSFVRYKTKSGDTLYVNIHTTPLHNDENEATGTIYMLRDVTQRFNNHQQLVLWSSVFTNSGEGIIITDSRNRIISVNRTFTTITGYGEEEVLGKNPGILASGRHDAAFYRDMWQSLETNGSWKGELWNRRKNGDIYPEWLTITTLKDADGETCNHIASFSDATLYKEKEERIKYLAYHDKLTGLPNRSLLEDRLSQAIAHARRLNKKIAVLFLDLDRFKVINDTLGHHMGDKLLQETAQRLCHTVRSDDTVCRQGGDEFIVIVQDLNTVEDAAHMAQNVLTALSAEFEVESENLKITPSIGISLYPDDGEDIETLIKHADTAMYHAKEQGRSNYQFFTTALNDAIQEKMYLEKELGSAISRRQLSLHFQPQVRLLGGNICGAEVLLCWDHPTLGHVPADKFIPIAEDSGLIDSIGQWVLHHTAIQLGEWREQGIAVDELTIAVNISARQLEGTQLISCIEALFAQYPYMAGKLELEITETALMRDVQQSVTQLNALKDFQLTIAVDDFGTGYSSLAYLKRLPIDTLKIDRTFIKDIPGDEDDAGITEAIIRLAQTMHLSVIAEGIETAEQEGFLLRHHCSIGQGYLYSHPLPADEFSLLLQKNTPAVPLSLSPTSV